MTYIDLFENSTASVGIFVLKRDAYTMPLHDHPSMYGFIKVIFGKIRGKTMEESPKTFHFSDVGVQI